MQSSSPRHRLMRWVLLGAGAAALTGTGCAHGSSQDARKQMKKKIKKLKSRVEELERSKGRLSVRLKEMEDEIFLLQDRVEANRLTIKRRRNQHESPPSPRRRRASKSDEEAAPPRKTPDTNYQADRSGDSQTRSNRRRRGGSRLKQGTSIPSPRDVRSRKRRRTPRTTHRGQTPASTNSDGASSRGRTTTASPGSTQRGSTSGPSTTTESQTPETESSGDKQKDKESPIVITEEDFEQFASQYDGEEDQSKDKTSDSTSSDDKRPRPSVTDETLATSTSSPDERSSGEDSTSSDASGSSSSESKPYAGRTGLDLYRMALAKYRSGEFETALEGFRNFMKSEPRKDYRDNGLYWIGECEFGLGHHEKAIDYFQRVLDEEPHGNKVPDAMLKMALAYRKLGKLDKTKSLLEKVTQRYPGTNAGRLADKKLSTFDS